MLPPALLELQQRFGREWEQWIAQRYAGADPLSQGCAYALRGPGKRVRPLLCLLFARATPQPPAFASVWPLAAAVELVHTYSLVHDDLPAFDDDDWRRGRPTVHRQFGETQAILVGDALLTDAWELLARAATAPAGAAALSSQTVVQAVQTLAAAAGSRGMVRGQSLDMQPVATTPPSVAAVRAVHAAKTGALLAAACELGARCAYPQRPDLARLAQAFGAKLGAVFQMVDDLLDPVGTTGKTPGKDAAQGKWTLLRLLGPEALAALIAEETAAAQALLAHWPQPTAELAALLTALMHRRS